MTDHRAREGGFTLVELLVVIVVLSVVSAVVMISAAGFGGSGRTEQCKANYEAMRTGQEARFTKLGAFGTEQELVDGKYIDSPSELYDTSSTGEITKQPGSKCIGVAGAPGADPPPPPPP